MFCTRLRFAGVLGVLLLASGLLSSCLTAPDYPIEPEISFKSIKDQRVSSPSGIYDTITVTVSFRDGDGDLGLSNEDIDPPYNRLNSDNTVNRYYNNYFFQPEQLVAGSTTWTPVYTGSYDSRYPRLTDSEKAEPIKGDLNIGLKFYEASFPVGAQVRFRVSIADRALHESNVVVTDPITIQPY